MFMVAERGINHPLKITTIQFHPDLSKFLQQCHIDYINHCANIASKMDDNSVWAKEQLEKTSFKSYLHGWFSNQWIVYECTPTEVNKKTGKPKKPTNIAECKRKWNSDEGDWDVQSESRLVEIAKELGYNIED